MMLVSRADVAAFADLLGGQVYQPKGMFFSELFLFLSVCKQHAVNLIIESGVKHGGSTRVLGAAHPGAVLSIDREFVIDRPAGVQFVRGDSTQILPALLALRTTERVGVLIDGPKGAAALALKNRCLTFPNVRVVAVHDEPIGRGEHLHSADPRFRRACGDELDRFVAADYATKYPTGPGLAIWERA